MVVEKYDKSRLPNANVDHGVVNNRHYVGVCKYLTHLKAFFTLYLCSISGKPRDFRFSQPGRINLSYIQH